MRWPFIRSEYLTVHFKGGLRISFHAEEWDLTDSYFSFISLDNVSRAFVHSEIVHVSSKPSFCWIGLF